jgi:hypothetical protein
VGQRGTHWAGFVLNEIHFACCGLATRAVHADVRYGSTLRSAPQFGSKPGNSQWGLAPNSNQFPSAAGSGPTYKLAISLRERVKGLIPSLFGDSAHDHRRRLRTPQKANLSMGRPPKKYHWATISRKYDNFEIAESDWKAIQSESNYTLDGSTRDHILNATRHFLMMAEGEQKAPRMYPSGSQSKKTPKLNAAELRLKKIKASAKNLSKVLLENPANDKNKPEFEADHEIMMYCEELPELGGARVSGSAAGRRHATRLLADILSRFLIACDRAESELKMFKKARLFDGGAAWNEWVAKIRDRLVEQGYRVSASPIHSKQENLPPFILLIKALQKRLPQESIWQRTSGEALAKAVDRALRRQPQDS